MEDTKQLIGLTPQEVSDIYEQQIKYGRTSLQHLYNAIWQALKEKNNQGEQTD